MCMLYAPRLGYTFTSCNDMMVSAGGTFSHVGGLHERPGLPSPLGPPLWPLAFGPGNPTAMPAQPFQQLTTCSWEQNDTIVKVYVPLKGIQTDMLRPAFTSNSAEVSYFSSAVQM